MIVCDVCKKEIINVNQGSFTISVAIRGDYSKVANEIPLVHACSSAHFVIGIARAARQHAELLRVDETVLAEVRALFEEERSR